MFFVVVMLVALIPVVCNAAESSTTTVGRLMKPDQGGVVLAVNRFSFGTEMVMHTYDQHNVNRVFLRLSTEEILKLRDLLDATLAEYKKQKVEQPN